MQYAIIKNMNIYKYKCHEMGIKKLTIVFFFSTFSLITALQRFLMVYESMLAMQFIYLISSGVFTSLSVVGNFIIFATVIYIFLYNKRQD